MCMTQCVRYAHWVTLQICALVTDPADFYSFSIPKACSKDCGFRGTPAPEAPFQSNRGRMIMSCKSRWWRGGGDQTGTSGRDWLFGARGDNTIDARAGNDFVWTGRGHDNINGGSGNDLIRSGRGSDNVNGGAGSDRVFAGSGDDVGVYNVSENAGAREPAVASRSVSSTSCRARRSAAMRSRARHSALAGSCSLWWPPSSCLA